MYTVTLLEENNISIGNSDYMTCIVVPCFNEANRLPIEEFESFIVKHSNVRILFVNDGSTDATEDLLKKLVENNPEQMHTIRMGGNVGKGEAVRQGLLSALHTFPNCKYLGYWDSDLSTPLKLIFDFTDVFLHRPYCQFVIGSRIRAAGRNIDRNNMRHYLGRIFSTVSQLLLKTNCYDTQCGAKIFANTDAFLKIIQEPFSSRWLFDLELLVRLRSTLNITNTNDWNKAIFELPLSVWKEKGGSKIKIRDAFIVPCDLLRIYINKKNINNDSSSTEQTLSSPPLPLSENTHDSVELDYSRKLM